jgi:hypothetical protein
MDFPRKDKPGNVWAEKHDRKHQQSAHFRHSLASHRMRAFVSADFAPNTFVMGIGFGIPAGFLEEIGWTGYAFPQMCRKLTRLTASICSVYCGDSGISQLSTSWEALHLTVDTCFLISVHSLA